MTIVEVVEVKDWVRKVVNESNGIKAIDLRSRMIIEDEGQFPTIDECDRIIQELVDSGEIVELEFIVQQMDYRIKSMYFPKGTRFGDDIKPLLMPM